MTTHHSGKMKCRALGSLQLCDLCHIATILETTTVTATAAQPASATAGGGGGGGATTGKM